MVGINFDLSHVNRYNIFLKVHTLYFFMICLITSWNQIKYHGV
jgi:hypothetical protein